MLSHRFGIQLVTLRHLAVVAAFVAASRATAQPTVVLQLEANSALVSRGVTTTNRPVINPAIMVVIPTRIAEVTLGAWTNAEPLHFRPATMLDSYRGAKGPLFSTHELWAEGAHAFGGVTTTFGASAYLYPRTNGLAAQYNTVEARVAVEFPGAFAPTLTGYRDLGPVGGSYLEFGASRELHAGRHAISADATAGWSMGQGAVGDPETSAYFAQNGFTHAELAVSTEWHAGRTIVAPSLHMVFAGDPWARFTGPDEQRAVKVWVGTALRWKHTATGKAARAISVAVVADSTSK
jgi:hypothetical protein